jgi:hypothetical protein
MRAHERIKEVEKDSWTCGGAKKRHGLWQNQPELHRLKCADPFSEGSKDSTALQTV